MALVVPDVGEVRMAKLFVNNLATTGENVVLRLYKTNVTPGNSDTTASYTESTFTGYAAVTCTSGSWTITGGAPTTVNQTSATTFTVSGTTSETCYGYFVTAANSSTLCWAEKFSDGPYTLTNVGDKVIITLQMTVSAT